MERTQIYLTEDQKKVLAFLAEQTGEKQSVHIRRALDDYLTRAQAELADRQKSFWAEKAGSAGSTAWAWDGMADPHDYVAGVRATADARLKSLYGGFSDNEQSPYDAGPGAGAKTNGGKS